MPSPFHRVALGHFREYQRAYPVAREAAPLSTRDQTPITPARAARAKARDKIEGNVGSRQRS